MKKGLAQKFGLRFPIFQAPMAGGLLTPEFVARVCEFGMLGSVPAGYLGLDRIREFVERVKKITDRPFALNLFVDYAEYGESPVGKPKEILSAERAFDDDAAPEFRVPRVAPVDELIRLAVRAEVPAVSTVFGLLNPEHSKALKAAGVKLMCTVNSVYELELALKTQNPDAVVYQNALAGGHKGGFTSLPHSGEREILEAVSRNGEIPCALAGGVVDREDVASALARGFHGVQIGTAFLATQESGAGDAYKRAMLESRDTAFTTAVTGRPARGAKNRLAALEVRENLGFPFMHYATADLRNGAKARGDSDWQSLWCGAGVSKIDSLPSLNDYMSALTGEKPG